MIKYLTGDATAPVGEGNKIIVHVCNDIGGWGRGFVLALSKRWPTPESSYRAWAAKELDLPFELGQVQFVEVAKDTWVANMIGQHKTTAIDGVPPVRYEAIEEALGRVAGFALDNSATVHMPRIGCGLAGGIWGEVESRINLSVCIRNVSVTVYDLPAE